jgi:hypothetical protein
MNTVKQIDIWLKNEPGTLSVVSDLLGENRVNIVAFYVTTQGSEGKLRFVANDPEKAINVLKSAGYKMKVKDVIACEVPHHPGGLKDVNINVDYFYPCIGTGDITVLILGVEPVKDALRVLNENWMRILGPELYHM